MAYIGKTPTPAPLTSSDITDGIISTDKLADTSVTNAKINADLISAETELATAPADTDELLISDAGTLKRIDASLIGGGGIEVFDQWRITAHVTSDSGTFDSNWERVDNTDAGYSSSNMSQSSGIFTFPSTGMYLINFQASGEADTNDSAQFMDIQTTSNNSSYATAVQIYGGSQDGSWGCYGHYIFDVTNTSTHKVKFIYDSNANSSLIYGSSTATLTGALFLRLADT